MYEYFEWIVNYLFLAMLWYADGCDCVSNIALMYLVFRSDKEEEMNGILGPGSRIAKQYSYYFTKLECFRSEYISHHVNEYHNDVFVMQIMQMQCSYPVACYANIAIEQNTWKRDVVY